MKTKSKEERILTDIQRLYERVVMNSGSAHHVTARGMATQEVVGVTITITQDEVYQISTLKHNQRKYADDLTRIELQFGRVVHKIQQDKFTRQAVISNWDHDVNQCFTHLQFLYRKHRNDTKSALNMIVYFRSCDVIGKFKDDLKFLANVLYRMSMKTNMRMGEITLFIASLHIYEKSNTES